MSASSFNSMRSSCKSFVKISCLVPKMSSTDYGWSSLPPDLLWKIASCLSIHSDYIRFRAVCNAWRSSTPTTPTHLPCQLPWLMLPQSGSSNHRRAFFNLANNKYLVLHLPEASYQRRCCGSSHGCLVILDKSPTIFIINPLTRSKFNLPPLSAFPCVSRFDFSNVGREYLLSSPDDGDSRVSRFYPCSLKGMRDSFIKKIILSNSPFRDAHFTALAIINRTGDLACYKLGQTQWTLVQGARFFSEDVIYFNGLAYAVDKYGNIAICEINGDSPHVMEFIRTTRLGEGGDMQYLVDAYGELLLVTRILGFSYLAFATYETNEFRVFRLDLSEKKWERVMSLGEMALFLGGNSSLALLASDFPGCKGNRIYFTDDYCELDYDGVPGHHDLGIFSLEDGGIEELPCYPRDSHTHLLWPPPVWITPNPW